MVSNIEEIDVASYVTSLIAELNQIKPQDIDPSILIWEYFVLNTTHTENKTVPLFIERVCNQYAVFMTEKDWESPTIHELATKIITKSAQPEKMIAQYKRQLKYSKIGFIYCLGLVLALSAIAFFSVSTTPPIEKVITGTLCMCGFVMGIYALVYYVENRKFRRETKSFREKYKLN